MRFLLRALCAGLLASPVLAAPNENLKAMEIAADHAAFGDENDNNKSNTGAAFNPLVNFNYPIANPYAEAAEKTYTISAPPAAPAPEATRVSCGGRTWTDGEYLGRTSDGKQAFTKIHQNRVYLNWGGQIPDNIYILFYLVENTFPNNPENDRLIWNCVNPIDPSVQPQQLLGNSNGKITCNGHVMEDGEWLGTFVDNGAQTIQYTKYVDGILRVMIKQGINDDRTTNYNTTLMKETIFEQHGSFINPKWRGVLTLEMFNGCYWSTAPKPATPLSDGNNNNNCQSGPALQSTSNVSQTGLRFSFSGSNIGTVKWRIKSNGNVVRENITGSLNGNTNVDISYPSLNPGNYTLEIEGGSCTSTVSSRAFTINAPSDPTCQSGPSLQATSNESQTGLRFTFTGSNIGTVRWRIKSNGTVVRENITASLNGNTTVDITYNSLNYGTYTLEVEGGSCTSAVSSRTFTINAPTNPNCQSGPALQSVSNQSQTGLRFAFTGTNVGTVRWRIRSNGTVVRENITASLNGNTTVDITYNSLNYGTYTLEIEGGSCISTISSRTFSINAPTMPDCQNGPSVNNVRNLSPTSATVEFGGSNLHIISWRILQNSNVMASGKSDYINNNTANIGYSYLRNGEYTIEITAEDCKASAPVSRSFTLDAPDTRPNCDRGPKLEKIINANAGSLEFLFDGNNIFAIDWKIMQNGNMMRQSRVAPQNNHPVINYATLPTGVYTIEIDGGNCKSTATSAKFGVNVPLPIYISNFKGDVIEKGVELTWEVVAEQDGKEFEVLRYDANMKNVQTLATIPLTDQRTGLYRYIDEKPLLGVSYYQLKQIDADGSFMTSKIVAINPIALTGKVVAPNPAREYVDVQFSSRTAGETEVKIYTVSGVQISTSKIKITEGRNVHRINVQKLITGKYLMRIAHGGEESTLRFLKVD